MIGGAHGPPTQDVRGTAKQLHEERRLGVKKLCVPVCEQVRYGETHFSTKLFLKYEKRASLIMMIGGLLRLLRFWHNDLLPLGLDKKVLALPVPHPQHYPEQKEYLDQAPALGSQYPFVPWGMGTVCLDLANVSGPIRVLMRVT